MQTPIPTRPSSLELPQKSSRVVRKLKTPGSDSDSPNPIIRMPKDKSPKVVDRKSPRNTTIEKKKPTKLSELETQVSNLQDELKKVKDQLGSTESSRRRAKLDAEEAKKHLVATSAKLEQTQRQLDELTESDDSRVQELRKISQDRDRAWQSELEALQKQQSFETATLASAMNEAQKFKAQLERVSQSARAEIQSLRDELSETLDLVEKLREEVNESQENEARAREEVTRAEMELEVLKSVKAVKSDDSLASELEESKNRVRTLEELVGKMSAEVKEAPFSENDESELKNEVCRLRAELEAAEKRYRDEYIQSTLEIRSAYELVETAKSEFSQREAELEAELEELRASGKENELERIELKKLETQLRSVIEENETLKSEIEKNKIERSKENDEVLMKIGSLADEAAKSSKKAERVAEELDATQVSNSEMEAELRRLKVQSDQWRKAAEAAAAMLSSVNNGKYVERSGSMEHHTIGRKLDSEHSDDTDDDESPKKWNGNVLKKIGVLLKKGQK
ncbi:hypothetical protein CASFOL_020753 [Castilleja foliolosa]|uniref:Uncharacterized protein n=1 Tax=Castilleja foliolosa TaxID=1961234 RepID=A0ABD3D5D6_9LAMI